MQVFIISNGYVGQKECKTTQTGKELVTLSVGTSEYKGKDSNGKTEYQTIWHDINIWGKSAEYAKEHVHKADKVNLMGKIMKSTYENKQGQKVTRCFVNCDRIEKIYPPKQQAQGQEQNGNKDTQDAYYQGGYAQADTKSSQQNDIPNDDIPF